MNRIENAIEWNLRVHRVDVRKMIEQGVMSEESVVADYNRALESVTPAEVELLLSAVKSLQSKLEIAEKALEKYTEPVHWYPEVRSGTKIYIWDRNEQPWESANQALQQIRS
jgi:hypothetical protein